MMESGPACVATELARVVGIGPLISRWLHLFYLSFLAGYEDTLGRWFTIGKGLIAGWGAVRRSVQTSAFEMCTSIPSQSG